VQLLSTWWRRQLQQWSGSSTCSSRQKYA
jgi:hypothetical protein